MQLSNPEIKILRDELARVIADIKKRDSVIEQLAHALEEEKRSGAEKDMAIDLLERRLMIYENAHSRRRTAACLRSRRRRVLQAEPNRPDRPKERPAGCRAASLAIRASPTTGDPWKQYTTGRANAAGAEAPESLTDAPLPSR